MQQLVQSRSRVRRPSRLATILLSAALGLAVTSGPVFAHGGGGEVVEAVEAAAGRWWEPVAADPAVVDPAAVELAAAAVPAT